MTIATNAAALPNMTAVVSQLQALTQQLSALVQQLQAGASTAGGGAAAGAAQVGGGTSPTAATTAPGGCGCGGAAGAVQGVGQVDQSTGQLADVAATPPPAPAAKAADAAGAKAAPAAPKDTGSDNGAPKVGLHVNGDQKQIDAYLQFAGKAYGSSSSLLHQIAKKESSFSDSVVNTYDINAQHGHPSEGMFQFIPDTFKDFASKAKAANPKAWEGLGDLNIKDWRQQALACSWALQHGHTGDWATYDEAKAAA